LFISSKSGQNSTAVLTKDLFVKREIDLLANGNFKAGDIIQIRFRLYSDPYSHGWGWIIDNLVIQDIGTGQQTKLLSEGEVLLFPNPTARRINLQVQSREIIGDFSCKAIDLSGKEIFRQVFKGGDTFFQTELDLSDFGPGLYLFVIGTEKGQAVTRKILIR